MARRKISQSVIDQKNRYLEFKNLFASLVSEFHAAYKKYSPSYKWVTDKVAMRQLALTLYKEILIIIDRIDNELVALQNLEKGYKKYWRVGKIEPNSRLGIILREQMRQRELLTVDIKALFQWIFVLDGALGGNIFPKAITFFRHIFVVHFPDKVKQNKKIRKLMTSMLFSQYEFRLIFIPFLGSKNFSGFRSIENQVKPYIPEISFEKNYHEKVRIIWENLDRLPTSIIGGYQRNRNHFLNLLSQYGSRSPSLLEVMQALTNIWNQRVKTLF